MIKMIALLKRRADLPMREFIAYYETKHVPLIMRHLGSYFRTYTRTYLDYAHRLSYVGAHGGHAAAEFDVVTEISFKSQGELDAMFQKLASAAIAADIAADEERFLDRSKNQIIISEVSCITTLDGSSVP
jgi:hypothetical protein